MNSPRIGEFLFTEVAGPMTIAALACVVGCSHREVGLSAGGPSGSSSGPLPVASSRAKADAVAPEPSPFHVVATGEQPFLVHPLRDNTFVQSGSFVGRFEGEKIEYDAARLRGLGLGREQWTVAGVARMFGEWPREAWALVMGATGRSGYTMPFRWEKDQWRRHGGTPMGEHVEAVYQDDKGWVGLWIDLMAGRYGLMNLSGTRPLPKPSVVTQAEAKGCAGPSGRRSRNDARGVATGPDKRAYAFGTWNDCAAELEAAKVANPKHTVVPVIDVLDPGAKAWRYVVLPPAMKIDSFGAKFATVDALYVAFGPALYRVSGGKVAAVEVPAEAIPPLNDVTVLSTGELVAVDADGQVFRFSPGAKARRIPLPAIGKTTAYARSITRLADDDLLLTADDADAKVRFSTPHVYALLRTKPMVKLEVSQAFAESAALREELPFSFDTGCRRPLVLLYEVPNSTPRDFAFDATAKAIASEVALQAYEFVDFVFGGKRFLAARLTLGSDAPGEYPDYALRSKSLIKAIEVGVAGSKPKLVCHAPHVTRTLRFDGTTKALAVAASEPSAK